jgi:hypothetical protein
MTNPDDRVFYGKVSKFDTGLACAIMIFSILFGSIIALLTGVWPIIIITIGLGLAAVIVILYDELIRTPKIISVSSEGFLFTYRTKKQIFHSLEEIQWLNLWLGSKDMLSYSEVKVIKKSIPPKSMPYEAGQAIKQAYIDKFGVKPLNYKEYLSQSHEYQWYSTGPSE